MKSHTPLSGLSIVKITVAILGIFFTGVAGFAAPIIWNGPSTTNTANLWSQGANWTPSAPQTSDDVKFFDLGNIPGVSNINNTVDASMTIGSLQYGNTNGFHTTLIASGATLTVTNTNGLSVFTPGDPGSAITVQATITGSDGTLYVTNPAANLVINQGQLSGGTPRAVLDLSGLDTFIANISHIGIGSTSFPNPSSNVQRDTGTLYLAKTNTLTVGYTDTLADYETNNKLTGLEMSRNPGNSASYNYLYLGISNLFYIDSLGIGRDKSTPAHYSGIVTFNPAFLGKSPSAWFRGVGGPSSAVTWWAIGDMNNSSSSSQTANGTNDFTGGYVNALVNTLSLGRDGSPSSTATGVNLGVLTFNNGSFEVSTSLIGNQSLGPSTSTTANQGFLNVNSPSANYLADNVLILGNTVQHSTAATNTVGFLNVTSGNVYANKIAVGNVSISNTVNLVAGTLFVTNTIATNASGLFILNISNSTLGLTVPSDGSLRCLVHTLNTISSSNPIQLINTNTVIFSTYPQQFPLIKYTTWTGSNTFALANVPGWAPGATIISNGPNKSVDLSLPYDPRPVITSEPIAYSGPPGTNVTSSLLISISPNSVTPIGYQWYYVSGGVTNTLNDGAGPSGSSTLSGSLTTNLQILNPQTGDSGDYFVVATNAYGTNTSDEVLLTISSSPITPMATGPGAKNMTNGITASIHDAASGSPVPTLYWQFDGTNITDGPGPSGSSTISGSSTATLTIVNPQYPGDQGTFSLIASNSAGFATNNTVVTVLVAPGISTQPSSLVVTNGNPASFTVVGTGVPNPIYQWFKNNAPVSSAANHSATNATFTLVAAAPTDMASYYVQISNAAGSTNSVAVRLTVNSASLAVTAVTPTNGANAICYDTPLYLTFNAAPTLGSSGTIKIYNATNSTTPVDTIDLSQNITEETPYAVNVQARNIEGAPFFSFPVIISNNTAAIYPHLDVLTSNQTYYVTVDDGAFLDSGGSYFAGIPANTWQFTTKPAGPANPTNIVVAADGSGDFLTVQGAVDSVPANNTTPTTININNGVYIEIIYINGKNNLDLRGQSRNGTFVGYPNNNNVNQNGAPWRASFILNGNNCSFENLTLTNMTPAGGSQAEAVDVEGTEALFENVELDSYQDTFLVHSAGKLVYFQDSLITGQTDFNWGYGTVYYTNCELRCTLSGGHVTQPRSPYTTNGFGFYNCRITQGYSGSANFDLGRTISTPTSPSEVLFADCLMASVITGYSSDAGTNMSDYACSNLTATAPVILANSVHLTASNPYVIAIQNAATWLYGWQPQLLPNVITNPIAQSASVGQSVSFVSAATGVPDPSYQWYQNGNALPGATSATLSIPSAVRTNGGAYYVVASNTAGSATSSIVNLTYVDTPPVANPVSYTRYAGAPLRIYVTNLLSNVTDADNDTISLTGVSVSTNGVTLSNQTTSLLYDDTNDVNDQFTYTVTDGFGGNNSSYVNIVISTNSVFGQTSPSIVSSSGTPTLTFDGIAGYSYSIERSPDLINWTVIWTTNMPAGGVFQFDDNSALPQDAFYRLQYNP